MWRFGAASERELAGVDARLVAVVRRALALSPVDFACHDGKRSEAEQREYVARGVSKTMDSRHLTGHAVDLVPWINGKPRWEWAPIYQIAGVMRQAAREAGLALVWGGAWGVAFTASTDAPADLVEAYVARRRAAGKRAFIDGPHYEMRGEGEPS